MKEKTKKFSLSFAELALLASKFVANMTRDAAEFDVRGVDDNAITAFEALGNAFEVFPPDEVFVGEIKDLTTEKNILRDTITDEIQLISGFFEQKWGIGSGKYTSLRISGLQKMTEGNFLLTCRNVVEMATACLSDLSPIGLTQGDIDTLEADAQSFEDKLIEINSKKELRDNKAEERVDKANELYDYVAKYSTVGKLIWENVSEANYNDYVIYKTEEDLPGKVLNLGYDSGNSIVSWDVPQSPEPIDKYELERSVDESNWLVVYDGAANEALVPLLSGANYFRCRAHNKNGWGSWSDTLEVNVGGIDAPDWVNAVYSGVPPGAKVTAEQVEVTWANVAEANMYEIWRSVVNVDDPAGDFTMIDEEASEMYLDFDLTKNKRNYYYIIAKNETDRSEASDVAFADVVDDV